MEFSSIFQTLGAEIFLSGFALAGLISGAIWGQKFALVAFRFGALALILAAIFLLRSPMNGTAFNGLVEVTPFISFAKFIAFICAGICLYFSAKSIERDGMAKFEYPLLMVFACIGIGVMLSAGNLMTLYLGIETLSLSSYVLAAFNRNSARSSEAGVKYFVLGALASGILLYGMALVFGFAGSADYTDIANSEMSLGLVFGLVLMSVGLAFKMSAAPMHVWTPDVYEGAPTPVVAFFATAPKIASVALFASTLYYVFPNAYDDWRDIAAIIAAASMLIGSLGALLQRNIKRLLAYSSIANVGFALIGVVAGEALGREAVLIYMTIYAVSTLALFAAVLAMRRKGGMVEDVSELAGLSTNQTWLAICLTVLIFSVAGIPPLAGFWGKWVVFQAGWSADAHWVVFTGIISSVISLGYYLRLIKIIWVDEPTAKFEPVDQEIIHTILVSTLLIGIVFVIFIGNFAAIIQ